MRIDLVPFSPCLAVQALRYTLISESSSELRLTVQLKGSIASELEDVDQVGQREFGLWQHHCFELFLGEAGSTAYWELNLARMAIGIVLDSVIIDRIKKNRIAAH